MFSRHLPAILLALLFCSCHDAAVDQAAADHQSEWRDVLGHKKAAVSPGATQTERQVYADSLAAFLQRHPDHNRALEVYTYMQYEFARELAEHGRYRDAIRFYRAVLVRNPQYDDARRGLQYAVDHLAVSREKLLTLEKGMSRSDVARILGKPVPGWTARTMKRDVESWYYRTSRGGVAGVYFRGGRVFAAEERSDAQLPTAR